MSHFFIYDELTWPDVAGLPRDIPLILPLGLGYPLDQLASSLGNPPEIGLMPAIPFGFLGSGLAVADTILGRLVYNLVDSLRDEGFSRVFALTPQGVDLGLGSLRIALPHPSQFDAFPDIPGDDARDKVVLVPIGHTEQHGYHSPLSTDTIIIGNICATVAELTPNLAVSLPVMPYGVSTHRASFAGTLNCGGRAFEDFWLSVLDNLITRGFDRFYLMSGHGGNSSFLVNIVKYAGERHRRAFIATSWLYLSGSKGVSSLESHRRSPVGGMGHACELETSLLLHLRPDLIHMDKAVDEMDFVSSPNYYMDWVEGGALIANPPWDDDTKTGAYGAGSLATAENGRIWFEDAVNEKIEHVGEIHDQFQRRTARRNSGYGLWGTHPEGTSV